MLPSGLNDFSSLPFICVDGELLIEQPVEHLSSSRLLIGWGGLLFEEVEVKKEVFERRHDCLLRQLLKK